MKRALITGITGQDGSYLAEFLLAQGYEVTGVVNISFPVLNSQGNAIAGLTVPYVKRIEDTIGIPQVVDTLAEASRQISQAMGAVTETTDIEASAVPTRRRIAKVKK